MFEIYVDGGVLNNEKMYIGILCISETLNIKVNRYIGIGSSHIAEEGAILKSIEILSSLNIYETVNINCDNKSVVDLINSEVISEKHLRKHPGINVIRRMLDERKNINVGWIKRSINPAHELIKNAYNNVFFDELSYNIQSREVADNAYEVYGVEYFELISRLESQIERMDVFIGEMIVMINNMMGVMNKT